MRDAEPLQRFEYVEEYVEAGCCGCGGGWRAASVAKKNGNSCIKSLLITAKTTKFFRSTINSIELLVVNASYIISSQRPTSAYVEKLYVTLSQESYVR